MHSSVCGSPPLPLRRIFSELICNCGGSSSDDRLQPGNNGSVKSQTIIIAKLCLTAMQSSFHTRCRCASLLDRNTFWQHRQLHSQPENHKPNRFRQTTKKPSLLLIFIIYESIKLIIVIEVKSATQDAGRTLLRPIASMVLKCGMTWKDFSASSRSAFVEAATNDYELMGVRPIFPA